MMFNFHVNQRLFYTLATGEVAPLAEAMEETRDLPHTGQWANFLRNHDELDLGRLSEKQRAQVFKRFGPEKRMHLYDRGIRRRLAPMLGTKALEKLAYSVMFSLPGTPVLRYGDEIGMGDDLGLPERDAVRTPMHWSCDPQGGFSTNPKTVHPVISEGPFSYHSVNVEAQRRDPASLLNWTAHMIRIRKECPEIGWGDWKLLKTGSPHALAVQYEWRGSALVIVHNFAEHPIEVKIKPDAKGAERLCNLLHPDDSQAAGNGWHKLSLEAHGYRWFRAGKLTATLQRPAA